MTLPNWTREPLVHFLGLGALVYIALTWGGEPVDPSSRVIDVDDAQQAQIALSFEQVMGRAPTDAEFDNAIERYVRDEVLYREALRLGLDQGDAVVRQRLVTKMDLSASAGAELAEPDETTLRAYFDANADRYAGEALVSFDQEYFASEDTAQAALSEGGADGGPISLPAMVEEMANREVKSRFGEEFARAIAAFEPGEGWQGPIRSGFGWHLVRLRARSAETSAFETVQDRVENDWRSAEIESRKQRAYEVLRSAYRIEIDR